MMPQRMTVPPGGQRRGREQAGEPPPGEWEAARAVWVTLGIALGLSVGLLWLLGATASPAAVGLPALRLAAAPRGDRRPMVRARRP